jgi:hypothetical protein
VVLATVDYIIQKNISHFIFIIRKPHMSKLNLTFFLIFFFAQARFKACTKDVQIIESKKKSISDFIFQMPLYILQIPLVPKKREKNIKFNFDTEAFGL